MNIALVAFEQGEVIATQLYIQLHFRRQRDIGDVGLKQIRFYKSPSNDSSGVVQAHIEVVRLEGLPQCAAVVRRCVDEVAPPHWVRAKKASSEGQAT